MAGQVRGERGKGWRKFESRSASSILIIGRFSFSIGVRINRNDALNKGSRVNEFLMKFRIHE